MRITCINKQTECYIELQSCNILSGPNNIGKTEMMNYLYSGFQGKLKQKFVVDGNEVEKDEFYAFLITETDSLDNEKLLGSKSIIRQNIDETYGSLEDNKIEQFNEEIKKLKKMMDDDLLPKLTLNDSLSIDVSFSITDILSKFASVVYDEIELSKLSYSTKRIAYFKMYINLLLQMNQKSVLFIDGFDNGLSRYEAIEFVEFIKTNTNDSPITIILSCSHYYETMTNLYCGEGIITNDLLLYDVALEKLAQEMSEDAGDLKTLYDKSELDELICKHSIFKNAINCYMSNRKINLDYVNLLNV